MPVSSALPSLLLLPPPPSLGSRASFSAAYRPPIVAAVSALRLLSTSAELLVVLPCPTTLRGRMNNPRPQIYHEVQELLGRLYSLICIVCAKLGIDVDSDAPGAIDARIILLDYDPLLSLPPDHRTSPECGFVSGPFIDLVTFAMTRHRWHIVFSVDGEAGQKILTSYSNVARGSGAPLQGQFRVVGGGLSKAEVDPTIPPSLPDSSIFHKVVVVGGTFDHLHAGHKLLLTATALLLQPASKTSTVPRRLIVGITGDELLKNKKYAEYLQSWKQRQEDVVAFLLSILSFTRSRPEDAIQTSSFNEPIPNGKAIVTKLAESLITIECVEIQDPFGPTITDESATALVVSGETRSGGQAVNDKRAEKGWKALDIYEVDVLDAQDIEADGTRTNDFASKISSTAARKRKADGVHSSSL